MASNRPIDFAALRRGPLPNRALLLPPGFPALSNADLLSPIFSVDEGRLMQVLLDLIESEARLSLTARFDDLRQIRCVARSAGLGFPDDIWCQIGPHESGGAMLFAYSRARFGLYDFGVNRRRLETWVRRLQASTDD